MSHTPRTDAAILDTDSGYKMNIEVVPAALALELERENRELLEALKAIDMDEALYATYFHSPPLNPMGRVEWERRQAWLTKARAAIAKAEGK